MWNLATYNYNGYKNDKEICGENGESCNSWGEWAMKAMKLDSDKWTFSDNALSLKSKNGELCGEVLIDKDRRDEFTNEFDGKDEHTLERLKPKDCFGNLVFVLQFYPEHIKSNDSFCQKLKNSYLKKETPYNTTYYKYIPLGDSGHCDW